MRSMQARSADTVAFTALCFEKSPNPRVNIRSYVSTTVLLFFKNIKRAIIRIAVKNPGRAFVGMCQVNRQNAILSYN